MKLRNPNAGPFDAFDEVVENFGGSVGYFGDVPVGDLRRLGDDGSV